MDLLAQLTCGDAKVRWMSCQHKTERCCYAAAATQSSSSRGKKKEHDDDEEEKPKHRQAKPKKREHSNDDDEDEKPKKKREAKPKEVIEVSSELQDFWSAQQPSLLFRCDARLRQLLRLSLTRHWCSRSLRCCLLPVYDLP